MNGNSVRGRLLASTVLFTMGVAAAPQALAQAPAGADKAVEEIVVTGSRIRRTDTETPAPVLQVDPQVIEDRGFVQAGQIINQVTSNVPQVPQASGSGSAAGTGQQFPNLFGLGAGRTLTLVNGRRFVTSSSGLGDAVVDTNIIPVGLLKQVDIVQAGGAAVYGSDAIAGVVNYVFKDNFEGIELDGQYGRSSRGDYNPSSIRGTFGKNLFGGRANVAVDLEWSKTDPLLDYDRPRSNLARVTASNPANTSNTDGIPALVEVRDARFWSFNYNGLLFTPAAAPVPTFIFGGASPRQFSADGQSLVAYNPGTLFGVPFASGGDGLSYRELAALYVGVERFSANLVSHYDFSDHLKLRGEFLIADVKGTDPYANSATNTVLNAAATGAGAIPIARTNPYLTPAVTALLGPGGPPLFLSKAFTDLLPTREGTTDTLSLRALLALEGDFNTGGRDYYWSVSYSHAQTDGAARGWGVWTSRFNNAVQAVRNSAGAIVCGINADASTANDDAACAPINPFGQGNVSQAARDYVSQRIGSDVLNFQDDFLANLGGDVIALPGGMSKFSLTYEHRREEAKFTPLVANQAGRVGSGTRAVATRGQYNTNEFSAEVLVPLVGGDFVLPAVQKLEFDGSFRYVDNSIAGHETVWSAGGRWEAIEGVSFRASRSRNFRAPTLNQLFAPSVTALGAIIQDPCDADRINSGPNPTVRRANCTALFAANPGYGPLATFQDPAENFSSTNITTGGNPSLSNEISNTTTFGIVLQPTFVPGLTIVADRIIVNLRDGLSAFTPQNFLATCFDASPQPSDVCSRFTRDATGQVVTAQTTTFNAGRVRYRGEVYNVDYQFPLGRFFGDRDLGDLGLSWEATHTSRLETSVTGFDLTRTDGTTATPDWNHRFDVRYSNGPLRLTYSMIYLPRVKVNLFDTIENTPTPSIKRNIRQSVSGAFEFKNYTVRAGIVNITDEEPSFPTRNYGDILGRQFFVGLNAKF